LIAQFRITNEFDINENNIATLTGAAFFRIFPQEIASSGRAPLSLPSNSEEVLIKTA